MLKIIVETADIYSHPFVGSFDLSNSQSIVASKWQPDDSHFRHTQFEDPLTVSLVNTPAVHKLRGAILVKELVAGVELIDGVITIDRMRWRTVSTSVNNGTADNDELIHAWRTAA